MVLKEILTIYHKELDERYGKNEVDSFFNILIEHYLGIKRIHLGLHPEYSISKVEEQPIFEALSQLKLEKPIQYILGETEFYGLPFKVNEDTLIPRPETEELVGLIIANSKSVTTVNSGAVEKSLNILDIGTGTGCIAISLAQNLSNVTVSAIDVSPNAIEVAKHNAQLNGVEIDFICDDILNSHQAEFSSRFHKFDIIVSNPPYVRNLEKAEIQLNVLDNEPHLALFVDDDNPLQFYKAICKFAQNNLYDKGTLYFEINEYLGEEMIQLMCDFGFKDIKLRQDMFGKDRMIFGVK